MHLKTMLLAITAAAALSASTASGAAVTPLSFAESGLGGGGFQNVIAIDPADSGLVLAGGDTSGIYRSLDWGTTWQPADTGLTDTSQSKIASIEFSPAVPGRVYAAAGNSGSGGGLLESDDSGQTWARAIDGAAVRRRRHARDHRAAAVPPALDRAPARDRPRRDDLRRHLLRRCHALDRRRRHLDDAGTGGPAPALDRPRSRRIRTW